MPLLILYWQGMMMGSMSFVGSATLLGVMYYGGRELNQGVCVSAVTLLIGLRL